MWRRLRRNGAVVAGVARASRRSRTSRKALASSADSGRLIQKMVRHELCSTITAPYSGPSTLPSSCTAPTIPSGSPRRPTGHSSATSARVTGTSPPPPRPWMVRPATTMGSACAEAVSSDPQAKAARQATNTGRRP